MCFHRMATHKPHALRNVRNALSVIGPALWISYSTRDRALNARARPIPFPKLFEDDLGRDVGQEREGNAFEIELLIPKNFSPVRYTDTYCSSRPAVTRYRCRPRRYD